MSFRAAFILMCIVLGLGTASPGRAQEIDFETDRLPYQLSDEELRNLVLFSEGNLRPQERHYQLPPEFSARLNSRPRRPLESRVREAATDYAKHPGQYVRCQLTNGRVVVGTVDGTDGETFSLRTGVFNFRSIKYSEVVSEPQPVNGAGQKFVRGAAIAGMVVVVVILLPILIPIFSLACLSGSCVD